MADGSAIDEPSSSTPCRKSPLPCHQCRLFPRTSAGYGRPHFWAAAAALVLGLILSKVHSSLDRRFGSSISALGIDAEVAAGKVVLKGALSDERMIVETVRLMHTIPGVQAVESRIGHIAFSRESD